MSRRAIVPIDLSILGQTLFGKGALIIHARPTFNDYGTEIVEVILEHPNLDDVETGALLPRVMPVLTKHEDGSITMGFEDAP